jgi:succinylglutamic semialdehyde dehydrogenase
VLGERRAEIVALLIGEAGKCRSDAENEADLLPRKITITLDLALARTPGPAAIDGARSEPQIAWRPRGVAAVLGPFNFPLHLLHGLVVPALAVGCTVVAKPSERCPGLGELYRACVGAAGLGQVCRIVQGGRATAAALIAQPALAVVAAVGGRAMGLALARALAQRPEVVLALELGGVNPALVLPDADLPPAAAAIAEGAWRMAGQRCTATRQVHVPAERCDALLAALRGERERWRPSGDPAGAVGTMIDHAARERFLAAWRAAPAGLELVAGGLAAPAGAAACAEPLLLILRDPALRAHPLLREEQFGPALVVDPYTDRAECLARLAANPYRLAASVFTASRAGFLACAAALPYGLVNHNRQTAGARSDQPFGGLGLSGNGRPAALAANHIFADETVVW